MRVAGPVGLLAMIILAQACSGGAGDDVSGSLAGGITLSHLVDLGGPDDPASPLISAQVAFWPAGGYAVGPMYEPGFIYLYAPDGSWVGRIGGTGQGPGELGRESPLYRLRVRQDSLWVSNPAQRTRLTAFPPGPEPPLVLTLKNGFGGFFPLGSGAFLVNRPSRRDSPLWVMGRDGTLGETSADLGREVQDQYRLLGPAAQGGAWVGTQHPYDLELLDDSGRPVRRLTRRPDWYPEPSPDVFTLNTMVALWENEGVLWAITLVDREPGGGESSFARLGSVIEALDPETGEVLATLRDDRRFWKVSGAQQLYQVIQTESGDYRTAVYSIGLTDIN